MHAALGKRKRAIKHVCTVTFKVCMRIPGSVSQSCKSVADINYLHSILKLFLQSSIFDAAKVFRWYFLSLRCWKHFSGLVSLIPKCKISKVRWQCSAFQICLFAYAVSHKRPRRAGDASIFYLGEIKQKQTPHRKFTCCSNGAAPVVPTLSFGTPLCRWILLLQRCCSRQLIKPTMPCSAEPFLGAV